MLKNEQTNVDYLKKRYEKNPDIVSRKIADETLLVPVRRRAGDIRSIFTLDEVGSFIWELIDGKEQVGQIKEHITEEFDVTGQRAEEDLIKLLKQLEEVKAIKELS